jgi:nitrite reductase/ring-hydroxylating ferredoxin subunit
MAGTALARRPVGEGTTDAAPQRVFDAEQPMNDPHPDNDAPRASAVAVDVCIVGWSLTALSIAYELSVRGKEVAVVSARGSSTSDLPEEAWLTCAFDGCFTRLELRHGAEGARLAVESHAWAIDRVEHIAESEGFDCGFTRADRCFDVTCSNGGGTLDHERAAAYRAGLRDARLVTAGNDKHAPSLLLIPRQAFLRPRKYFDELARTLRRMGAELHPDARVDRLDGAIVQDERKSERGISTQRILAFDGEREIVRASIAVVTTPGFVALEDEEAKDVVARIGFVSGVPGIYVARPGTLDLVTDGVIAGALIGELSKGRGHRWERLYDANRRAPAAIPPFDLGPPDIQSQLVPPGACSSTAAIAPGDGCVVRLGNTPFAVYRDDHGALHEHSAICPHLGGIVRWNAVEKTFDCPCHGARFDRFGHVVSGPTVEDLAVLPSVEDEAPPESQTRISLRPDKDAARPWDVAAQRIR